VDLYIHSPIRLLSVVLNQLSTRTTTFTLLQMASFKKEVYRSNRSNPALDGPASLEVWHEFSLPDGHLSPPALGVHGSPLFVISPSRGTVCIPRGYQCILEPIFTCINITVLYTRLK
jgi:hypothetical protein